MPWLLLALLIPVRAWAFAPPATPQQRVTDGVGVLSTDVRADLEARLASYERASGHQIVVWIGSTSGEVSVEELAARSFEAWRIGRAGLDDGVALFVLVDDRTVRIEVGYGIEDRLTDLLAARIVQDRLLPRLAAGDYDAAITEGVSAIVDVIEGRPNALPPGSVQTTGPQPQSEVPWWRSNLAMILFGIAFLILFIVNPRLALFLLWSLSSGRRGFGGGFGGPSGFAGGGGRSGGGGATGRW